MFSTLRAASLAVVSSGLHDASLIDLEVARFAATYSK